MSTNPDTWVYGDFTPDPSSRDLVGLKARWIIEQLPAGDAPAVLDYGSGEGKHLHLVRTVRPRARLVGVDVRPTHSRPDFEFHHVGPRDALPFADHTFDVVVSCDVLEHVEDLTQSLAEIRRVLRPGGSFIGFVPAEGGAGPHGFFRMLQPGIYRDTKDHNHAYTRRELRRALTHGFAVKQLSYSYHLLGASLDATFFASFKLPGIGPRMDSYWRGQENSFYRGDAVESRPSAVGRMVKLANQLAYHESRLLRGVAVGAKGLHFHVVRT